MEIPSDKILKPGRIEKIGLEDRKSINFDSNTKRKRNVLHKNEQQKTNEKSAQKFEPN